MSVQNQKGSALLVVITVVYGLFLIGLSLQAVVGNDLERAVRFRNTTRARYIATAGTRVVFQQLQTHHTFDALNQSWHNNEALYKDIPFAQGSFRISSVDPTGKVFYGVRDEESKIHLNKAPLEMLAALPGIGIARATAIVRYREQRLFNLPTEILTLASIQPDLFPAVDELLNIQRLMTVWGSGKININTAPKEVLATLPGINTEQAETIVRYRRGPDGLDGTEDDQPFPSLDPLRDLLSIDNTVWPAFLQFATVESTAFSFRSEGRIGRQPLAPATATIQAVVERQGNTIEVKYWKIW